jgi:WD40 repeat protein
VWDVRSSKLRMPPIRHRGQPVLDAAISPDGALVATCAEKDPIVCVWEIPSGRERWAVRCRHEVRSLQFDPMGRFLVTCGEETTVWTVRTGTARAVLPGTRTAWSGRTAAISADGSRLAVLTDSIFEVYELPSLRKIADNKANPLHLDEVMHSITISGDGSRVATASTAGGAVWDASTGLRIMKPVDLSPLVPASFNRAGTRVVLWDLDHPAVIVVPTGERLPLPRYSDSQTACFSPDGKMVAVAGFDPHRGSFTALVPVR